jgi:gliding motility-associated lipoprotein GldB
MINKAYIIIIILAQSILSSCDIVTGRNTSSDPVHINRFDKDLFQLVMQDTPELQGKIATDYPAMLKVIGLSIFDVNDTQQPDFFYRLVNYYSEPALNKLYRDAIKFYDHIEVLEANLGSGFQYLKTCFPSMQIPAVYMHVSGFQQNTLVANSLLSISIDKYLGLDYPLYKDFFYDYQLRKMTPERIVPDYLKAWLLSDYPFKGNNRVLLERMIYEGKIKYIIHKALPKVLPEVLMGYSSSEYTWCKQNEKVIWRTIIERNHLYTPDATTTEGYFADRPSDFISNDAPGDLGSWIGWQIVTKYMERTKVTIEELMKNVDYQGILMGSRYKPNALTPPLKGVRGMSN